MNRRDWVKTAAYLSGGFVALPGTAAMQTSHNPYFTQLNTQLKAHGPGRPVMLLDLARMNHNIDQLVQSVGKQKTYRVVVKSLPSIPLLQHVMQRASTRALMVFHQPFLNEVADAFPDSDVLLGKPMPVQAAATFYNKLNNSKFDAARQVQWLIDSQTRLEQYLQLAQTLGVRMGINLEINVGLYRGGLESPAATQAALKTIKAHPQHLHLRGLMGYEPHLTGLKADLAHPAVQQVLALYQGHIAQVNAAGYNPDTLTLNGAGSHTLKIYQNDNTMNDLAAGSGVVMPTDFDTHHLTNHQPALFIATPILKRYRNNPVMPQPPANMQQVYYIYGGYWKADMVSPEQTGETLYKSTNQSPITTSADVTLDVDDYMFLRPTQSEFVMLQFGDLMTVRDGKLADTWPVFQQTG